MKKKGSSQKQSECNPCQEVAKTLMKIFFFKVLWKEETMELEIAYIAADISKQNFERFVSRI